MTAAAIFAPLSADDLEGLRWAKRVVVVAAPPGDPRADDQARRFMSMARGFQERDTLIAEADVGIRRRFGIAGHDFAVLLIGKDGGEKDRWNEPVDPSAIFAEIDGMPMRRQEMKGGTP